MRVCNISTAEALFNAIENELESHNIPWENVVGDTASVMVGVRNSVLSRIKQKQRNVFSLGCMCHLAALCAVAALKKLPLSVDDFLVDIFYHFKYSAECWTEYDEIQSEFSEIRPMKLLKHCTTSWLSLEHCIKRVIDQWPALFAYFDREMLITIVYNKLPNSYAIPWLSLSVTSFRMPLNKFYFQCLPDWFTTIGRSQIASVVFKNLIFIKPEVLTEADDITEIEYRECTNQVDNDELRIGTSTRLLLCGGLEDDVIGTVTESHIFLCVRTF